MTAAAIKAVHVAICEYSLDDCMQYHGRCVKAVEALVEPEGGLDQVGPYPLGSPEFHIWQAGHRAGWKSERRTWQQFTGCKYPQDVRARFGGR